MDLFESKKKIEILAPGGSVEGVYGAINCGADAVYVGGQMFGARAYADNPDKGQLTELIQEMHLRGKKLYLTVNTLLKDRELTHQLVPYLEPFYENGLDAVIVQDFGVWQTVKSYFPEMALHASTQMTVVSPEFTKLLKNAGASRIVPARELSIDEIKKMKQACDIEVETFVHGALCYCYSGQCLMSSMIGGRSGNRGRCAQPCRLPYQFNGGKASDKAKNAYLLSPKDICTLDLIPDMVDAGIDSFKIEGRMKKPEYAALVSMLYRKYTDLYLEKGRQGFKVDKDDVMRLMDLYNRGGFTDGYYNQHNGRHMISVEKPNHFGTAAAEVKRVTKDKLVLKALNHLNRQDILELSDGRSGIKSYQWTLKEGVPKNQQFVISNIKALNIKQGTICFRTRNGKLIEEIQEKMKAPQNKEKIYGHLKIFKDLPVTMTVVYGDISVEILGETAQAAVNRALTAEDVRKQIGKTGNTPYIFEKLDIDMDKDVFVPVTVLNQIRRGGLEMLKAAVLKKYERTAHQRMYKDTVRYAVNDTDVGDVFDGGGKGHDGTVGGKWQPKVNVLIGSEEVLPLVLQNPHVFIVYLEYETMMKSGSSKTESILQRVHMAGKRLYLALPHMIRNDNMFDADKIFIAADSFDGALVRNMEGLLILKNRGFKKRIVADARIYSWNQPAKDFVKSQGAECLTVPEELNFKELKTRGCAGEELIVYGYRPLMISAQCLLKTKSVCLKEGGQKMPSYGLTDRTGRRMAVVPCCAGCYNLIYNSQVLDLSGEMESIRQLSPESLRIELTSESEQETAAVLSSICGGVFENKPSVQKTSDFTKGHFRRGVE